MELRKNREDSKEQPSGIKTRIMKVITIYCACLIILSGMLIGIAFSMDWMRPGRYETTLIYLLGIGGIFAGVGVLLGSNEPRMTEEEIKEAVDRMGGDQ